MADTHPPGGWPWGKNKQSTKGDDGSEAPSGTTQQHQQDAGVQEPELMQEVPHEPISEGGKGDNQSQAQSKAGEAKSAAGSAIRGSESAANKSVKYEDDKPVSAKAPSNKSFSRSAKEPSVASHANTNGGGQDDLDDQDDDANDNDDHDDDYVDIQNEANDSTEDSQATAESKKDDLPEDEGKDLSEPTEHAGEQEQGEAGEEGDQEASEGAEKSQSGSKFSNFLSGASKAVPSFGGGSKGSGQDDSQIPESIRKLQEEVGDDTNLTLPGGTEGTQSGTQSGTHLPEGVERPEDLQTATEETDDDTHEEGTEAGTHLPEGIERPEDLETAASSEGGTHVEGLEDGEELRPEDSLTYAADNSHPPGEGTEGQQTGEGTGEEGATEQEQSERQSRGAGSTKREGSQSQVRFSEEPTEEFEDTRDSGTEAEGTTQSGTKLPEGVEKPEDLETATGYTYDDTTQAGRTQGEGTQGEGTQAGTTLPEGAEKPEDLQTATGYTYETATQPGQTQGEGTQAGTALPEGVDKAEDLQTATGYTYETATNAPEIDYSILKGCTVNKLGNVVNDKGQAVGRIVQGITEHLIGRKVDENGIIWNDSGKEIGRAEPIPDNELQDLLEPKPFESFEGNTIDAKGNVIWNGQQVGKIIEGDLKLLQGKSVDPDGEVLDKAGNVIGRAERWEEEEEPEPEPEAEIDRSILAGKRVNKAGNVVDGNGVIYGRVIDGDLKRMIGRMCNKNGEILSESGDVLGHAELVSEGEREGSKEGIFADLEGLTINKDGHVVTPAGEIVGRLITGDPKILAGRAVDEDGDVVDKNGNVLGKAERWAPEEVEKEKGPMAGLTVNQEGNVVDNKGNLIGKLTSGDPLICAGKEIDDDGDVINSKGMTVGHVNLLADIPQEPEPEGETEEEKEERLQREQDKKLAIQMAVCLEQCLDKIKPICKLITTKIEATERKPEDERDEEALVKEVRPLIEEGSNILREAHGVIRGLDPDGHIQANAKHKTGTREATPEEFHLAEVIKELTGTVTETIDGAKRKLEDLPHAKKELNPLWGLLGEPLFQIIAAVGLLLSGVLGIVGRLLSGLGLGGIVDGLLGTLGLNRLLDGLGLGSIVGSLTGKKKK
ncbi:hypothetical protein SLS53_007917 [Cytospora paraplurivora]|uniref:DUF6987 domain-containing protein n=1 Tax=Cytospora paraplurivora TaxID=2898453 RepID=A0AAN9TZ43_9PEZI